MGSDPGRQSIENVQLDRKVGYLLRRAHQRSVQIFSQSLGGELTPVQFSVMLRLAQNGPMSQNRLGRSVAMDAATTKGVVARLCQRDLVSIHPDGRDRRRYVVSLTEDGLELIRGLVSVSNRVSDEILAPLSPAEREAFLDLLERLT